MEDNELKAEVAKFMRETAPVEDPPKKKKPYLKITLVTLATIAVIMLSVTYEPATDQNRVTFHPVDQSQVQFTVTKATADDWPKVRIGFGPGCSARHVKPSNVQTVSEI